ncbi:MAG: tRNA-dihydrouridine synthase [Candidatus Nomurabacteria bacterium]|jgi:tRNA-dihydrouridine synthase|nr:tRNA-dihydrouridine synthase [Candidatus Nomurabacteria bacterium]
MWDIIKRKHPNGFSILAPMEGVTNLNFRKVMRKAGRPDVFWTEFTNVSSFANPKGRPNAIKRLKIGRHEQPIVAQIWGVRPDDFTTTANYLRKIGYKAIDINMGCPDKNVVKSGGGSALIRDPELAARIIAATKKAGLPVSVKTRLGFSSVGEWKNWIGFLLKQDLAALTIHLRTRKEMSTPAAHYELLPEIIELRAEIAPKTLLIVNGDVKNTTAGKTLVEKYPEIDGFMIGRGVFEDPFCFKTTPKKPSREELMKLLKYHLKLYAKNSEDLAYDTMKRFFKVYVRDFPGASELRANLMETKSPKEALKALKKL